MTLPPSRRAILLLTATMVLIALLLLAAAFPVGWMRGTLEKRLTRQFGAAAHIGDLSRETVLSFSPVVRVTDLRIAQQPWAGTGNLAAVRMVRLRVHLLPLLIGRTSAELVSASGIRLDLVRTADRRVNWRQPGEDKGDGGGTVTAEAARIDDATIRYRDAFQKRSFTLAVRSDPARGFFASGSGNVDGAPVTLRVTGTALRPDRPWPFDARIDGAALSLHAAGSMTAPLRTDAMRFHVAARADDLKRLDRIIEAGLFGTQPVALTADVRHQDATWTVQNLNGTVGQSDIHGRITAQKVDGRTRLDGDVRFGRLNFEDLASDAGNARAAALEQKEGLLLVPNTRINIVKIRKTDGRLAVRVDHVVGGRRPSALRDISAVLTLDNRFLTVEPLRIGLSQGAITGKMIVDQRDGRPVPRVTLALDLTDSRIGALAGGGDGAEIDGRVDARARLTGSGSTIREAVGRSDGTIGIVARDGVLPARIAALIGFDIGRGLLGSDDDRARLRCAIVALDMKNGSGTFAPLLIDTSMSQTRGTGAISFPREAIAATLTGTSKRDALLVLPGYITARGTIREPEIVVPPQTKSVGNVLKAIGRAISGHQEPLANDADCATLSRRAIGR